MADRAPRATQAATSPAGGAGAGLAPDPLVPPDPLVTPDPVVPPDPRLPPGSRLAGLSVPRGIVLVGSLAWGAAAVQDDGSLLKRSGRLPPPAPWQRLPGVRAWTGLVRQARATSAALAALRGAPARPGRAVGTVVLMQALLAFTGVTLAEAAVLAARQEPLPLPATVGIGLLALYLVLLAAVALASRRPRLRAMYRLHGAEHRAIHAVERHGGAWRARHRAEPKEHLRCGTGWIALLLGAHMVAAAALGAALGPAWLEAARWWLVPLATLVVPAILAELGNLPVVWRVLAAPGLLLQRFTTQDPTEHESLVAEAATDALLGEALGAPPSGLPPASAAGAATAAHAVDAGHVRSPAEAATGPR